MLERVHPQRALRTQRYLIQKILATDFTDYTFFFWAPLATEHSEDTEILFLTTDCTDEHGFGLWLVCCKQTSVFSAMRVSKSKTFSSLSALSTVLRGLMPKQKNLATRAGRGFTTVSRGFFFTTKDTKDGKVPSGTNDLRPGLSLDADFADSAEVFRHGFTRFWLHKSGF